MATVQIGVSHDAHLRLAYMSAIPWAGARLTRHETPDEASRSPAAAQGCCAGGGVRCVFCVCVRVCVSVSVSVCVLCVCARARVVRCAMAATSWMGAMARCAVCGVRCAVCGVR